MVQNAMLSKAQGLLESQLDDELLVYSHVSQEMHILNPSARLVWELVGTRGAAEIASILCAEYEEAGMEQVSADVDGILEELARLGLLVRVTDAGQSRTSTPKEGTP